MVVFGSQKRSSRSTRVGLASGSCFVPQTRVESHILKSAAGSIQDGERGQFGWHLTSLSASSSLAISFWRNWVLRDRKSSIAFSLWRSRPSRATASATFIVARVVLCTCKEIRVFFVRPGVSDSSGMSRALHLLHHGGQNHGGFHFRREMPSASGVGSRCANGWCSVDCLGHGAHKRDGS